MKLICDRGKLVESLAHVGSVVVSRTPKPVLTCLKLTARSNSLTLEATDLEVAVRVSTPNVQIEEEGQALAPAEKLTSIARDSPDATLTLESDAQSLHIHGQDAHFRVLSYPLEDFPPIPAFTGEPDFELDASDLLRLIHQTIYATARENSRYAINGVLVEREGNRLALVATDGHRLALAREQCRKAKTDNRSAIVPTKALNILSRLLGQTQAPVQVKLVENQILFATESAVVISNLVEGTFPPYRDVIPRDGDRRATVSTEILTSAFRRAALLTSEESKGVRMSFSKDGLVLSSRAPEMGEAEIRVPLTSYEGDPIEIGFNPYYILDVLKVIGTDQVQMEMRAPNKPCLIRGGPEFLYVVMPVSLQ